MFSLKEKKNNGVRVGELTTLHGKILTPFFMPVGTVGSVKGVSSEELEKLGAQIILANTYHLYLRPGGALIKKLGGLHQFMQWDKPILTDSGGYQVFSLGKNSSHLSVSNFQLMSNDQLLNGKMNDNCEMKNGKSQGLVKVTEDGVEFKSHLDGSKHFFTPERVIQIQLDLGVDILMPLDVCPSGKATKKEVGEATRLTIIWAKRAKKYFDAQIKKSKIKIQNDNEKLKNDKLLKNEKWEMKNGQRPLLHGIVQGGMFPDLRRDCAEKLIAMNFDGYSVGGLAVDGETRDMWGIVKLMGEILPEEKPRYLMGVGTPDDIIKAISLGMDMFDCVLPTRMARHGSVYIKCHSRPVSEYGANSGGNLVSGSRIKSGMTSYKLVNLLNSKYRTDGGVIDEKCGCPACTGNFSRAYISHLIRSNEMLGLRLATLHNLWQYLELTKKLRENI